MAQTRCLGFRVSPRKHKTNSCRTISTPHSHPLSGSFSNFYIFYIFYKPIASFTATAISCSDPR